MARYKVSNILLVSATLLFSACGGGSSSNNTSTSPSLAKATLIDGCQIFPLTSIFNTPIDDVSKFPVHGKSESWKSLTDSGNRILHMDMGNNTDNTSDEYYGIPFNVYSNSQITMTRFSYDSTSNTEDAKLLTDPYYELNGYPDESDCLTNTNNSFSIVQGCTNVTEPYFPYPTNGTPKIEGQYCDYTTDDCPYSDHHYLMLNSDTCELWESYLTYYGNTGWHSHQTSYWNLDSNDMRPDGWTSADAAGLPILPLLAKASEASSGEINHALRVTFRNAHNSRHYDWPASHSAGLWDANDELIHFGALMRLRADFVIPDTWTIQAKAIAKALKTYGAYMADNGADFYIQGDNNSSWDSQTISDLQEITIDNMDWVDISSITSNSNFNSSSYRASWF